MQYLLMFFLLSHCCRFDIPGVEQESLQLPYDLSTLSCDFSGVLPLFRTAVNGHLQRALDHYVLDGKQKLQLIVVRVAHRLSCSC